MALISLHCLIGSKVVVVVPGMGVITNTVEVAIMSCRYYINLLISQDWSLHCIVLNSAFLFLKCWCSQFVTQFLSSTFRFLYFLTICILFIVK